MIKAASPLRQRVAKLESMANTVMRTAVSAHAGATQDQLMDAAETLQRSAASLKRRHAGPPVLELPVNATPREMRAARQRSAVRCGQDVFLPSWQDTAVGLPNALLRSALWSAGKPVALILRGDGAPEGTDGTEGTPAPAFASTPLLQNAKITTIGDVAILYTGEQLTQYDRRVFAACIDYYRADRPLSPGGDAAWIRVSFYRFLEGFGIAYSADSHRALRASLLRLQAAVLQIRTGGMDIPMPRLVEVAFADGDARQNDTKDDTKLRGRDLIVFRVLEPLAQLYGRDDWTKVPRVALKYDGIQACLATFYRTHCKPHWLPVKSLYALTGVTCSLAEFRRLLKTALAGLQAPEIPIDLRIAEVHMSKNKSSILVIGASWKTGTLPPEPA